jgi:two-component system response regulator AdeR
MALVLVVEDDREIAEMLELYLRHDGHRTERAVDGEGALQLFRTARPDLVVLDIGLPKLDGLEVLRRIRETGRTPVVTLTARSEEVLEGFRERARQQQVTLTLSGARVTAEVDQTRLMQVLGNLLDNALRATPAGGEVRLSIQKAETGVRLEVADSGSGIPEGELPHIFERFVQGKDTKGVSGLGLAIVEALVKLHGGSVRAANRAEGGASFQVRLPL